MILTLSEIMETSECYPDREYFARAIEAKILEKLSAQEPSIHEGWIDPNDKTQATWLPGIGDPVWFFHDGETYFGMHNGGSFQTGKGVVTKYFETWKCLWHKLPAAPKVKT